jgi:iron-sulfur cluster repair protein YtfE (RIC family)
MKTDYDIDYYGWIQEQARLLRAGKVNELDLDNLAEEMESLGRQEYNELVSGLKVLIGHILKWEYQPERQTRSWLITMKTQRTEIEDILSDNPSLRTRIDEALERGYKRALDLAADETKLPYKTFPRSCRYTFEQILDPTFPVDVSEWENEGRGEEQVSSHNSQLTTHK